jgi:hypothetical protein
MRAELCCVFYLLAFGFSAFVFLFVAFPPLQILSTQPLDAEASRLFRTLHGNSTFTTTAARSSLLSLSHSPAVVKMLVDMYPWTPLFALGMSREELSTVARSICGFIDVLLKPFVVKLLERHKEVGGRTPLSLYEARNIVLKHSGSNSSEEQTPSVWSHSIEVAMHISSAFGVLAWLSPYSGESYVPALCSIVRILGMALVESPIRKDTIAITDVKLHEFKHILHVIGARITCHQPSQGADSSFDCIPMFALDVEAKAPLYQCVTALSILKRSKEVPVKSIKGYVEADINCAIAEHVRRPSESIERLARRFGIPRTTLNDHITIPELPCRCGPPPLLSEREEDALIVFAEIFIDMGLPLHDKDVIKKARLLLAAKRLIAGNEDLPLTIGKSWMRGFYQRHPFLTKKKGARTDPQRYIMTKDVLEKWYKLVRDVMSKNSIPESRIINADETPLPLYPDQRGKIISFKKQPRRRRQKEDHASVSLLACISCDGRLQPSLFIGKNKTVNEEFSTQMPPEARIAYAQKGFVNGEVFSQWIDCLINDLSITQESPALLLLDGHRSRENIDALINARKSGLHIVVLPSKATADVQPLDKVVFAPFKRSYRALIAEVERTDPLKDKWTIPEIMTVCSQALQKTATPELIRSAFANTGVSPHNPQHVIDKVCHNLKKRPPISDETIRGVVSPVFVVHEPLQKKPSKRLRISGKCITGDEAFKEIQEAKRIKRTRKSQKGAGVAGESTSAGGPARKPMMCKSCGCPRKGHQRGVCGVRVEETSSEDGESPSSDDPEIETDSEGDE